MAVEPHALSTVRPEPPADSDYDAICAAVTATARGRWFLDEYAKRNRNADTQQVLAAIARMEAAVVGDRTQRANQQAHQEVRIELLDMARTIAQTRAEVAESRPAPSHHPASEAAHAATAPDVAAAAERLRQIAWTMRACGVEVVASDQIGQIAETILSADALRSLGDQRAHKLTEALLYLEHRIDRMLDAHMAVADGAVAEHAPAPEALSEETDDATGHQSNGASAMVTTAMAMIAAAMQAVAAETEPETEPAPSPATAEAAAATLAQHTARVAPDPAEFALDDDVVLTVEDSAAEQEPDPAPAIALAPEPEPTVVRIEPPPIAQSAGPDLAAPADVDAPALRPEPAELELGPMVPAPPPTRDDARTGFAGLELEPLVAMMADEPKGQSHPAAIEGTSDEWALPAASLIDDDAEAPLAEAVPPTSASPEAEIDLADDDLPLTLATNAMATGFPDQEPVAAPTTARAFTIAEFIHAPPPATATADPIAAQVDHDLEVLIDFAPDDMIPGKLVRDKPAADDRRDVVTVPPAQLLPAIAAPAADPVDFLAKAPPQTPPAPDLIVEAQTSRVQLSDALAAIECELFGSTRPDEPTSSPASTAKPPAAAKSNATPVAKGPLAALMAMGEDERIALFS